MNYKKIIAGVLCAALCVPVGSGYIVMAENSAAEEKADGISVEDDCAVDGTVVSDDSENENAVDANSDVSSGDDAAPRDDAAPGDNAASADDAESADNRGSDQVNYLTDNSCEVTVDGKTVVLETNLPLDASYAEACEEQGTVETLNYTCHSYALEAVTGESDIMIEKSMNVYLPYGYDESQEYDVLYLLHGTGGFEDYWIGDSSTGNMTCNVLDNMIAAGECKPVIIVSPTYYSPTDNMGYRDFDPMELFDNEKDPYADQWPMYFWEELRNDIIPLVESTYSTYAGKDVSVENLQATRDHRGFAGLSRGSKTTVNSGMMHCADLFAYIGSYSGAWADVEEFKEILESDEYKDYDFKYWYNGNGNVDFSLENHETFLNQVLNEMPEKFSLDKNVAWVVFDGGGHAYNCWITDLYNSLLVFFVQD